MGKKVKETIVYDEEDGNVLRYRRYYLEEEYLVRLRHKARFVKSFTSQDSIPSCIKAKWKWVGYWFYLQRFHLEMHTNLLIIATRPGYEWDVLPVKTQGDIAKVLDVSQRTIESFVSTCLDDTVIVKGSDGYYMNPFFGFNGKGVSPETCWLFRDSKILWDILTKQQKFLIHNYLEECGTTVEKISMIRESGCQYIIDKEG